ncbi:S41 family peptidase [Gaoshiqia sp. Z1-71]|uniref:S41 family peptidase n=1 Tax=Gaoshiqia hydrogeniformans TaxID=3290090 RepID=UPI003BF7F7C4
MKKILFILLAVLVWHIQIRAQDYLPTYFSKADFEEDIQYLTQKVTHVHPKFLDAGFCNQWKVYADSVRRDLPDSITFNEGFIRISHLLSFLEDGHTGFSVPSSERMKYMQHGGVTMPFTVGLKDDMIVIDQYFGDNRSSQVEGAKISSINSIASEEILMKMRKLSGSEKQSAAVNDQEIERYFGLYFWMFFGEQTRYHLSLASPDSIFSINIAPVSNSTFFELKNKYYPEKNQGNYELSFPEFNTFALLKIKQFADDLSPFLRQAFDTVRQVNCKNLIIDIRDNSGGNSRSVDSLLNYLIRTPYTQYKSIALRVSDEVKQYYQGKKPDTYKLIANLPVDTVFIFDNNMFINRPGPESDFFDGNVFVLINNRTYSAAATFAGMVKEYKLGQLAGQQTGGTIHYYGDYLTFRLPHMCADFFVAPKEFVQRGGDSPVEGVIPDIFLENDYTISEIIPKLKFLN